MKKAAYAALSFCATSIAGIAVADRAQAQTVVFNVPAGNLANALDAYVRQSGRQIIYRSKDVARAHSPGAVGSLPADVALRGLLAGSGFSALEDPSGAAAIVPAGRSHTSPAPPANRTRAARTAYVANAGAIVGRALSPGGDEPPPPSRPVEAVLPAEPVADIVVTGSRLREEAVQQTPIAVSVFSGAQVEALNASSITALSASVPNLYIAPSNTVGIPEITIRGFSTVGSDVSVEPGIATYIDGVYQPIIAGSLLDLYDVERVEVLRGPQGSLLGKSAAGGAILLTRSRPKFDLGGKAQIEYGNLNTVQAQALVNLPIVKDVLAAKLFASYRHRGEYVENLAPGFDDIGGQRLGSVRAALLFKPTDDFTYYLSADYLWDRSSQQETRNLSGPAVLNCSRFGFCMTDAGRRDVSRINYTPHARSNDNNVTGRGDWTIGGVKLTSVTGYRKYDSINFIDLDATPAPTFEAKGTEISLESISQELRLASGDGDSRLKWLIGGFKSHSKATFISRTTTLGTDRVASQRSIRDSAALFAHVDFDLSDAINLSVGARRSWDRVRHSYASARIGTVVVPYTNSERARFHNTSVEAGAQYKFSPTKMIYARYAEGYRGGGFVGLPASPAAAASFSPETSASYEVGAKTEWLDKRLLINVTLYQVDYTDLQRTTNALGANNTFVQVTANVADSTTKGIELETVIKPVDGLTLRLSGGYLDAKYGKYFSTSPATGLPIDLSGSRFPYAPKYTFAINPEYRIDLGEPLLGFDTLTLRGRLNHISSINVSTGLAPVGNQPGYTLLDASADLASVNGRFRVSIYGRNLGNRRYKTFAGDLAGIVQYANFGPPRTFGVLLGINF